MTKTIMDAHVRDELNALKTPAGGSCYIDQASNYTTTSGTFADIDSTNLKITCITGGGDVLLWFCGQFNSSAAGDYVYLDFTVDGTRVALDDGAVHAGVASSTTSVPITLIRRITGLSAASHTFTVQWKALASGGGASGTITLHAGAGTANRDVHPQMGAIEL